MQDLNFESNDLGETEEFLVKAYTKMNIGGAGEQSRAKIVRRTLGPIGIDELAFTYEMSYDADPLARIVLCEVHDGRIEEDFIGEPTDVFAPGDLTLFNPPELPYSGKVCEATYDLTVFDTTLLDRVATTAPDAPAAPVRLSGHRPVSEAAKHRLSALIGYLRDHVLTDEEARTSPLVVNTAVTHLAAATLQAFLSVFLLQPNWADLADQALTPIVPETESAATYWYDAIALFGAAMTPYEVFFFSSGGIEERWTVKDLGKSRLNVLVGFPLGGLLSIAIAACAAIVLLPGQISVTSLSQITMPVVEAGGKLALAFVIVGIVAATFGAALETTLSAGYTVAQYFGWAWGKFRRPAQAARFHTVMFVAIFACSAVLFTGIDPILVTEYSVVFSAIALPLTYLPILIVANDPGYMGRYVNGRITNALASIYLVIILTASLAAIPLMIVTGAGQ